MAKTMLYKWRDIPTLLRTPLGRMLLVDAVFYRLWPVLSRLAYLYRLTLARRTRVIAVIGTYGKTTAQRSVTAVLGRKLRNQTNNWSYLAAAVLRVRPRDRRAVVEVGVNGVGQMATYARMIRPDIVVVMSIGTEHNRAFPSLEVTRAEKLDMLKELPSPFGLAVVNGDDPNVRWMADQVRTQLITCGFGESNDVRASAPALDWPKGTQFTLHANGESRHVRVRLFGRHMLYPVLAAVAVAVAEGIPVGQFVSALESLPPTPGRLEPVTLANGAVLLRDDFKSSLETVYAALDVLSHIPARRRLVALGEIEQPPGDPAAIYGDVGERIAEAASEAVFVCRDAGFRHYREGAMRGGLSERALSHAGESVIAAADMLKSWIGPGDVVLVKGRNTQRLERLAAALSGRTVRCDIGYCRAYMVRCKNCPMLARGWAGRRTAMEESG